MAHNHNEYMKSYSKIYLKTKKGFIQRLYTKMKSRVNGTHGHNEEYYLGLDIMEKDKFYKWIDNQKIFHELFEEWERGGYNRANVPTIDRLDSTLGYVEENIEVVTFTENVYRSHKKRGTKWASPSTPCTSMTMQWQMSSRKRCCKTSR